MRSHAWALAFAGALGLALLGAPSRASADPGTCKCNSGCHANPGQCVKGNGCSLGYAPTCGYRSGSGAPECPKVGYLSCDGTCACVPIPNFCETVGGAEYCDAGPPDTGAPDTYVEDTYVEDTYVPPPDTYVEDTYVPPPDTYVPPPEDACVPFECPTGTQAVPVPGECDPFCAQPCGSGEFKCAGLLGTTCVDGFCVPQCLVTGCSTCQACSLGDGKCFELESGCSGDGGVGDAASDDTGAATDTSSAPADTGASGSDASAGGDAGPPGATDASTGSVQDPLLDAPTEQEGGCGCRVGAGARTGTEGLAAAAMGIGALLIARRRRRA